MCSHQTHTPQTWDPRIDPPLPLPPPLSPPERTGACDSRATRAVYRYAGRRCEGVRAARHRLARSPLPLLPVPTPKRFRAFAFRLCSWAEPHLPGCASWGLLSLLEGMCMGKMSDTLVHQVYVSASGMKCNIDSSSPTPDSRVPPPRVLGLGRSGPRSLGRTRARTTRGGAMHQDERRLVFNSLSGSMLPTRTQHPTPPPRCQTTAPSH